MAIDAVMCGDRRVILGMAVSGRSALEHASETVNFWIISQGYSDADKARLRQSWAHERLGTVEFRDITGESLTNFRATAYLKRKAAYARYYTADYFPGLERCVYLDTDLLVLRDIAEAMHMDLKGKHLAAVVDISIRAAKAPSNVGARLGLKDPQSYFNSGFLILDLDFWRASGTTKKIVDLSIEKRDILDSQDQDALNIMFEGETLLLDPGWNTSQYEKPDPLEGRIVHLIGSVKPWHARYAKKFVEDYYRDRIAACFFDVLDRTAYRGRRPWNPLGIGQMIEWIDAKIPAPDMIERKMRLLLGR